VQYVRRTMKKTSTTIATLTVVMILSRHVFNYRLHWRLLSHLLLSFIKIIIIIQLKNPFELCSTLRYATNAMTEWFTRITQHQQQPGESLYGFYLSTTLRCNKSNKTDYCLNNDGCPWVLGSDIFRVLDCRRERRG